MITHLFIQGDDLTASTTRAAIPLPPSFVHEEPRKITDEEKEFEAYRTIRQQRGIARNEGKRKAAAAKVRLLISVSFGRPLKLPFPIERGRGGRKEEVVSITGPSISSSIMLHVLLLYSFKTWVATRASLYATCAGNICKLISYICVSTESAKGSQ
jgi:hypothetical protein